MKKLYYRRNYVRSTWPLVGLCTVLLSAATFESVASPVRNAVATVALQQETVTVSGRVIDATDGQGVPSVSIVDNANAALGVTDANGNFSVRVVSGTEITFSFLGYNSVKRRITGAQSNLTVSMEMSNTALSEVAVTALGIRRQEKALGYSISTVTGEELTNAISNNWTDALTGKVAGLNLVKSGAGPAGSNQIILRGENSLTGDNSALIVVDGVVVSHASGGMTTTGSSNYIGADSPVDFGSGIADINPDDIESVSVLKGPGAAALYGSRGANGAIIITTKSGNPQQKGFGVSFSSNTSIATINRWPDYQYEYGQGVGGGDLYYSYGQSEDGPSTLSTSSAWGPKFDGQMYYQYNPDTAYYRMTPPERTLWRAYPNNRKDFFETATTLTNNLALSGGTDKTTVRMSYTNASNRWIVPNTGYSRNNLALSLRHSITDQLSISTKVNYKDTKSDNLPNTGYNNQALMYFIRGITPNMNLDWFKQYWRPGREQLEQTTPFSNLLDNPYFQSYEVINAQKRNGVVGSAQADYRFNDLFSIMVRTSMDFQYDRRTQKRPFDTYNFPTGYYREYNMYTEERNADALLQFTNDRHENIKYGASVGGAMMRNTYIKDDLLTKSLSYPGVFNFANSAEALTSQPHRREYAVNSLYALANISYKDYLFFDATLRTDWASTLASPLKEEVPSFFYPSFQSSLLLSELLALPEGVDFWKLRASVAAVGSGGTTAYLTSFNYNVATNFTSGLLNPTDIPNLDLKPEKTISYEVGTDFRLFKNRLEFDLALYSTRTIDQIIRVPIEPASGFASQWYNAGEMRNQGIEIQASGRPIVNKDGFNWQIFGNMSSNRSKIVSVPNEERRLSLSTVYGSRGSIEAREGGRYGDMYGFGYRRNADGDIIYQNGLPLASEDLVFIGNVNPTLKAGIGSEFRYKNFSFNFLFDGQWGGIGYSLTHAVLMSEGKLKKSIPGRYGGIIGNGVVDNGDGTYSPNTVIAEAQPYYDAHFNRDNLESNTFSTDFIKLRELRFDFNLPKELVSRWGLQNAAVGLYGRDLFMFTNWPAFDPEFGSLNASGIEKGAEIAQFPSTRTFGLNLQFAF